MEIALTLFDGTVMTGCIPAIIEPGDEGFVRSYSGCIIAPVIIGHCRELHGHDKINDDEECSHTPNIQDIKKGFEELTKIIDHLGYKDKVSIGLNGGASQFHDGNDSYRFHSKKVDNDTHLISANALNDFYVSLLKEYDLQYIEDAFHRTVESTEVNDIWYLIFDLKVSKTGSVSELIKFVVLNDIYLVANVMDSHSCESYDTFIADLCIGLMVDSMKIGLSCITGDCRVCNQVDNIFINMENISCRGFVNGRPDLVITGGEELDEWDEPICYDDY